MMAVNLYGGIDYEKFNFTPVLTLFNQVVPPGIDIIPAAQLVPLPCGCLIRVTISMDTAVTFSLSLTRAGVTTVMPFQAGAALVANALYMFDFNARAGDIINFQFAWTPPPFTATINVLNVDMIRTTGP